MKKLFFICAFALFACKNNTDNDLNLTGSWVLQTSIVEYFDANNKKICENSPSELQSLKNIEIKDGTITLKPNEAKSTNAPAKVELFEVSVLPITLVSFTATKAESGVTLKWVTLSEINNKSFEIEKSTNGINFIEIAAMPGKKLSNELLSYSFLDNNPSFGICYYRLKQIDIDGSIVYSNVVIVTNNIIPFVPIMESDNYTIDLSPMKIAGFSKIKSTQPNSNTMVWNSTANNVAYTGFGILDGVAHHASLRMVYVRH